MKGKQCVFDLLLMTVIKLAKTKQERIFYDKHESKDVIIKEKSNKRQL